MRGKSEEVFWNQWSEQSFRGILPSKSLTQSRLFVFLLGEHAAFTAGHWMCHMANCLCEKASWQALTDTHTAAREAARYALVPELTHKTNILRKNSPRCKLVRLSACNFLHCLFCCALKIWYLVLPCKCILVNSLLSHSCFSISLSLTLQSKRLSCGMDMKPADSWAWVDPFVIVALVTHPSIWHFQSQSRVFCLWLTVFIIFTSNMLCYVMPFFWRIWLPVPCKIWKQESKIAEMTNYFIVKNLKTHTLHSHWTVVYVTDTPQQFYMATHSWFFRSTQIHQTRIRRVRGTQTYIFRTEQWSVSA